MAATFEEIRQALATALEAISTPKTQILTYNEDSINPPTLLVIGPDEVLYDYTAQRGFDEWFVLVQGIAGSPTDRANQQVLDEWLAPTGATSVKAALEVDRTLGGLIQPLRVTKALGYRKYKLDNGTTVLGCEWTVSFMHAGI